MSIEEPYIIKENRTFTITKHYNPNYGDDRICLCGHPYHRHFDSYENMDNVGCKYCQCTDFVELNSTNVPERSIESINVVISPGSKYDKQPSIHVVLYCIIRVFFDSGVSEDIRIDWDDSPVWKDSNKISQEENQFMRDWVEENVDCLVHIADEICDEIDGITKERRFQV